MKRIIIYSVLIYLFIGSSLVWAQNGVVTNAILYHRDNDFTGAKKEIDKAVVNEKTVADPKAWYYKGIIYSDISRSDKPEFKNLGIDFLKESILALNKAKDLDASKGEYYKLSDARLNDLWTDVVNNGIVAFNDEKVSDALTWFDFAQKIKPEDTVAYVYGSYAAEASANKVLLKQYSEKLLSLNYKSANLYKNLVVLESDPAKKLELAKKGVAEFPKDLQLTEVLGDLYTEQGNTQGALNSFLSLAKLVPDNSTVLLKLALLYQKLNDADHALEYYQKALSVNQELFIAHYNSSIIYYEKGKAENEKVHKLSVSDYQKNGKQMEEEVNALFSKSLAHANSALKLTKDEADINNINLITSEIKKVLK